MPEKELVDDLYGLVDSTLQDGDDFKRIEAALILYDEIFKIVEKDSLARDGMEMIEAAMRGDS